MVSIKLETPTLPRELTPPISPLDYATTFGHPCGQRVLQDIQEWCHVYRPMYVDGMDAMELAYREGQRGFAVWLTEQVEEALLNTDAVPSISTEGVAGEDNDDTQ